MINQKDSLLALALVLALSACVTYCMPTRLLSDRSAKHVSRLTDILTDLRTLQDKHAAYSDQLNSDLLHKRSDDRKERESFDLLIQLNDPVKIQEVPKIKGDESLLVPDDVISGIDKRQGRWDLDYGLGGGRFGKREYDDYRLGGGRFGRDLNHVRDMDHVDLNTFDD
uniref:Cholecystokinin n=1 Tax=Mizuhopecten yessoensis TaxID=6573 RepID=A0A346GAS7_MIZYE|nr:cholecystokinin [Mizuhopecten yessoensis]